MEKSEAIQMMRRASAEIKSLRDEVASLQPRAEAFDALQSVLGLMPQKSQGYGEDWAWKLDRRADELEAEIAAEREGNQVAENELAAVKGGS